MIGMLAGVAMAVLATGSAGFVFSWLRRRSGSLIAPIALTIRRASTIAGISGTPEPWSQYSIHGQNRNICPAERSISASTSSSTWPTAIAPIGPA